MKEKFENALRLLGGMRKHVHAARVQAVKKFLESLTGFERDVMRSYYGDDNAIVMELSVDTETFFADVRGIGERVLCRNIQPIPVNMEIPEDADLSASVMEILVKWIDSDEFFQLHAPGI